MDENNKKSKKGLFSKILGIALSGILLGTFAGTSFYAVSAMSSYLDPIEKFLASLGIEEEVNTKDEEILSVNTNKVYELADANVVATVTDISGIAKAVMPSLVSIANEYTQIQNYGYFGSYEQTYSASGSGIIVGQNDTELLIVTNYHVVEGADKLTISFVDETTAEATVKGSEKTMDLAIVSVNFEELTEDTRGQIAVAVLGDSDSLQVGEPAIAIGNALGYGQSVTTGVISALDREISINSSYEITGSFIQTDAAINPGNSGGALLNMNGEVIGINSSKIGGSTVEGMGYAIPISAAKPIIENLLQKADREMVVEEERGYLGVTVTNATDYLQSQDVPKGAYIDKVGKDSAADKAGLMAGDIITKFGVDEILSLEDLQEAQKYYRNGQSIFVTVQRKDRYGEYTEVVVEVQLQGGISQ